VTSTSKPQFILDTSPLITLCSFKVAHRLVIEHILPIVDFVIVETVAFEGTSNPAYTDSATILSFLNAGLISSIPKPITALDPIIDNYIKLGQGERDTIRLAISKPGVIAVLDDYLAFVVATRFEIKTILLLDLLVLLVKDWGLNDKVALEIVNQIAPRYSAPFVQHTKEKLSKVNL
jgi:hypothetical protein